MIPSGCADMNVMYISTEIKQQKSYIVLYIYHKAFQIQGNEWKLLAADPYP